METSKILTADFLDILFEGRNKEYGAYELRRTYNRRMTVSIISMTAFIALLFGGYLLANNFNDKNIKPEVMISDVDLVAVKEPEPEPVEPPPVKPPEQKKIETTQYTPPKIVPDEMVKPEDMPPDVEKLEDTKISLVSQEGIKDDGIIAPPIEDGKGVVEAPKKIEEDFDKPFTKVEIDAQYPGGSPAWFRFLNKNLANQYPEEAVENNIQGTVVVQFIVDREGNVSDVRSLSGPKELQDAAMKVIKKSGKWEPGIQNGRKVPSYKKQPIVFKLAE